MIGVARGQELLEKSEWSVFLNIKIHCFT